MSGGMTGNRWVWLALGVAIGLAVAYTWPYERAYANTCDRDAQFSMLTVPVSGLIGVSDPLDGVFTLDFLTGDVRGGVLNKQMGKFTGFYYRNVAADFSVDPNKEARYAFASGYAQLAGAGGATFAAGTLYIAELTSGKVICYAFPWRESVAKMAPTPLIPMDGFLFRPPAAKE